MAIAESDTKNVAETVKRIIMQQLDVEESEVVPNARFEEDLGADSLDRVELIMALEEAFGIEIPDEDVERIHTVQELITYVEGKVRQKTTESD